MQPAITGHQAIHRDEELPVHNWRVARLTGSGPLAEVHADLLDWHQIARLVQCGCDVQSLSQRPSNPPYDGVRQAARPASAARRKIPMASGL